MEKELLEDVKSSDISTDQRAIRETLLVVVQEMDTASVSSAGRGIGVGSVIGSSEMMNIAAGD